MNDGLLPETEKHDQREICLGCGGVVVQQHNQQKTGQQQHSSPCELDQWQLL